LFHFIELEHLSKIDGWSMGALLVLLDPIIISFVGTVVFAVLGAHALHKQIKRIDTEGAKSVSVEWNLVFLAMFTSLMPYGFERESLALVMQCLLRAPFYVVIMRQLYKFHLTFSGFQWGLAGLATLATIASLFWPILVATGLLWVSVITARTPAVEDLAHQEHGGSRAPSTGRLPHECRVLDRLRLRSEGLLRCLLGHRLRRGLLERYFRSPGIQTCSALNSSAPEAARFGGRLLVF